MPLTLEELLKLRVSWYTEDKCSRCGRPLFLTNDDLVNAGGAPLVCDDCCCVCLGNFVEHNPIGIPRIRHGSCC